jgi:hypothetical protein
VTNSNAKIISLPVNEDTTQITRAVSGEHNILVYSDTESFGKIYSNCCKKRLAENDIVILLMLYEAAEKVKLNLDIAGIDVRPAPKRRIYLIIAYARKEIFRENKKLLQFLLNTERDM